MKAAVITNEVYVEIELLRKHGMSLRKIAEEVGCAVNTVRSHLKADTLPKYKRTQLRVTKLAPFEDYSKAPSHREPPKAATRPVSFGRNVRPLVPDSECTL